MSRILHTPESNLILGLTFSGQKVKLFLMFFYIATTFLFFGVICRDLMATRVAL